ncbi:MAG: VCBS repeat-containing protein, partial [Planctomycetes bacterium]|nr:VCBS repeat-containing protein [Planctomycetota bacterium]
MLRSRQVGAAVAACVLASLANAQFVEVTAPLGVPQVLWSTGIYGSGQAVADFDGDGDLDIVVAPMAGTPFRMFRNEGGMVFTDVSNGCGLGVHFGPHAIEAADIDNDGDPDLYVGG